jgi:hypothetical protein
MSTSQPSYLFQSEHERLPTRVQVQLAPCWLTTAKPRPCERLLQHVYSARQLYYPKASVFAVDKARGAILGR